MRKILLLIAVLFALLSCEKDKNKPTHCSGAFSIIVNNGKVLVSGWENTNSIVSTVYWIDSEKGNASDFTNLLSKGNTYQTPADERGVITHIYKALDGELEIYKFDQRGIVERGEIFYHKNQELVKMDTSALGAIITVCFVEDKPFFAGCFSEMVQQETGKVFTHRRPFIWDGHSKLIELPLTNNKTFKGVSCVYIDKDKNHYIGGLIGLPMYWKNSEPIILSTLYGEVNQIIEGQGDLYAVGLYNKYNSNSTSHSACYWKNGVRHDLEDNAQAYGIYIDGTDIYIAGSVGNVPGQYKPCYWKNGIRVDLED